MTKRKKYDRTITLIQMIYGMNYKYLPHEKPENTIGRPIVPYRKVLDGILYVLRTGCQWKMLPKDYGSGLHAIEDSGMDTIRYLINYGPDC